MDNKDKVFTENNHKQSKFIDANRLTLSSLYGFMER